jgi:uncharacterized membrane protein YsdA (DUF1294 family)
VAAPWLPAALGGLALLNLLTLAAFAHDKRAAARRRRRVPEATLLWMAALGGTAGALAGQRWLRHKTRKQPFARRLGAIALAQGLLLFALVLARPA